MSLTVTDLFCGGGGSSTGLMAVPGFEIRIAANHWDLAVRVHNHNHPDADHAQADLHQEDPRYFPKTDVLWASPECFAAGHLVTTARGQIPIEAVHVGDYVLTHTGRWRPVIRTQQREAPTVIVKGQGHPGIETTASHRFWLRGSQRVWRGRADQYVREYAEPGWSQIGHAVEQEALWATPVRIAPQPHFATSPAATVPPLIFGLDLTAAWWLIGRWVGDGSLTFGRNHEVVITCGFHETDELRERINDTGIPWAEHTKRTATSFVIGNEKARDWLAENFGHGSAQKQIPTWALSLPRAHRRALLDGYFSADGYTNRLTHGHQHTISTVSRALAVSTRLLAESLGHRVSIGTDNRTTYAIEGRTGVALPQWKVQWNPAPSPNRRATAWEDDLHAWSRVRSVDPGREGATVYNIEVEEDHSYVLDGIVVANCTKWSQAGGNKYSAVSIEEGLFEDPLSDDAAQRSRLLMFDVLRFAEHHRYRAMIVENVVDIATQAKYRLAWKVWREELAKLGYRHRVVSLNSMHAQTHGLPAPQSRDRIYIVCWRDGDTAPDVERALRPRAYCPRCDEVVEAMQAWKNGRTVGRYRQAYVYIHGTCGTTVEPGWLPAAAAIDWSIVGKRIGDRDKPLAEKTRRRIAAGIARYWSPFHIEAGGNQYDAADPKHRNYGDPNAYYRAWPMEEYLRVLHTAETKALAIPVEGRDGKEPRPMGLPFRTQTTRLETAMLVPSGGTWNEDARPVSDPHRALTTREHLGLLAPLHVSLMGGSNVHVANSARPVDRELRTLTAEGNNDYLLAPYYGTAEAARPVDEPIGTLTTRDRYALIHRHNSSKGDGGEMLTPASEYLRTLTTHGHQSVLTPGDLKAAEAQVDDCLFRMLEPHEVAAGMAFPADYVWDGNRRERVKLAGNAVTPPAARDLGACVAEALGSVA